MHITLISPCAQINAAFGLRTLSAWLREHGHATRLLFLPDFDDYLDPADAREVRLEPRALDQLVSLCEGSDLIGLSVMTTHYRKAALLSDCLKARLGTPIVWGGAHATARPGDALAHADMACVGEGEDTLIDLVTRMEQRQSYADTPGLWVRHDGECRRNGLRPLAEDLDRFPVPDYSMQDHHILFDGRMTPLTHEIAELFSRPFYPANDFNRTGYLTLTSRGCPHRCAYCHNSMMKRLYAGQQFLRWRSIAHVIAELASIRASMPYIDFVYICDDLFLARTRASLAEFSVAYKRAIGLPFMCCTDPLAVNEEKMEVLVDAGMVGIQMGIESGSPPVQRLFHRERMTNARMVRTARIFNQYAPAVMPYYDIIVDTPYETDEDKVRTLRLVAGLPRPFRLGVYALSLLPGTALHEKASQEGLIDDDAGDVYEKHFFVRQPTYLNLLMLLAQQTPFPGWLLRLCTAAPLTRALGCRMMQPVVARLYRVLKRVHGTFIAPQRNPALAAIRNRSGITCQR